MTGPPSHQWFSQGFTQKTCDSKISRISLWCLCALRPGKPLPYVCLPTNTNQLPVYSGDHLTGETMDPGRGSNSHKLANWYHNIQTCHTPAICDDICSTVYRKMLADRYCSVIIHMGETHTMWLNLLHSYFAPSINQLDAWWNLHKTGWQAERLGDYTTVCHMLSWRMKKKSFAIIIRDAAQKHYHVQCTQCHRTTLISLFSHYFCHNWPIWAWYLIILELACKCSSRINTMLTRTHLT